MRDSFGLGKARSKATDGATMLAIISGSLRYSAICLRIVEFRGPRSCCTARKGTGRDFPLILKSAQLISDLNISERTEIWLISVIYTLRKGFAKKASSQKNDANGTVVLLAWENDNASITVFVHAGLNALCQPAGSTLIPMCLIHHATPLGFCLADVLPIPSNRSFKEASASIACEYTVMLSRRVISADFTRYIVKNTTWNDKKNILYAMNLFTWKKIFHLKVIDLLYVDTYISTIWSFLGERDRHIFVRHQLHRFGQEIDWREETLHHSFVNLFDTGFVSTFSRKSRRCREKRV